MLHSRTLLFSRSKYSGVLIPEYIISFLPTTKLKFLQVFEYNPFGFRASSHQHLHEPITSISIWALKYIYNSPELIV